MSNLQVKSSHEITAVANQNGNRSGSWSHIQTSKNASTNINLINEKNNEHGINYKIIFENYDYLIIKNNYDHPSNFT